MARSFKRNPTTGYYGVKRHVKGDVIRYLTRMKHPDSGQYLPMKYFKTAEEAARFYDQTVSSMRMCATNAEYPLNFPEEK